MKDNYENYAFLQEQYGEKKRKVEKRRKKRVRENRMRRCSIFIFKFYEICT